MNIADAIQEIRPGARWTLNGPTYNDLDWSDTEQIKPTLAEIQTAITDNEYKEKRRNAYPSTGDQLDALWKGGTDADTMKATIQAVKTLYPKPI